MDGSEENDKTRLKKTAKPEAEHKSENDSLWSKTNAVGDASDKTRVPPKASQKSYSAPPKADSRQQKNLQEGVAEKHQSENDSRWSAPAEADQTRVKPREEKSAVEEKSTSEKKNAREEQNTNNADSTRLAPSASDKTVFAPRAKAAPAEDKTLFAPAKRSAPASSDEADKTRFARPVSIDNRESTSLPVEGRTKPEESGELLKNRFMLEEVLGAGGMGVVYKAKDLLKIEAQDRDPYVAIKVLSEEFRTHPEAFIALQRESRKSQRIAHPNIVNVYDFDRDGETVFMTMEYLEGKPLDKLISQYKATGLPEDDAWKILEGICSALIHAHAEKIIHSDFKPGNIFVTNKGIAKVFDFGIARAVASAESIEDSVDDKTVFDAGNLGALTPAYASLEMLEGEVPDVRDDIYALGCIAYEMFSGRHPFDRVHANEAARRGMKPERLSVLTKKQWRVIESALAFKREDRVATVEEFWTRLIERAASPVRMIAAVVFMLVLIGGTGYQFVYKASDSGFSEDDVRSEIEMQLRIEQHKNNLAGLLASWEFTSTWEDNLWREILALKDLLGKEDAWLVETEMTIYAAYIEKIKATLEQEQLEDTRRIIANAARYTNNLDELVLLEEQLMEAIALAEQRKQEALRQQQLAAVEKREQVTRAQEVAERKNVFDQAMANVNEQLACRTGLNMRDFDIAITKLREVGAAEYRNAESGIIASLANCITKIGRSFPERATESKKFAMRIFPDNAAIEAIKIIPKDPCDLALAGLGASGKRAICRDRLPGEARGPSMVVIPAKGSMDAFAIGKYEVSVEEINSYCQDTKKCGEITGVDKELPATDISLDTARGYLAWLSDKAKRTYRLPTKAEWVYAARAESGSLDSNRNCRLNSRGIQKGGLLIKASVGRQNKWGLVNHVGNAREWVIDAGGVTAAVGGSFDTSMEECSVSLSTTHSGQPDKETGFRVLREIVNR